MTGGALCNIVELESEQHIGRSGRRNKMWRATLACGAVVERDIKPDGKAMKCPNCTPQQRRRERDQKRHYIMRRCKQCGEFRAIHAQDMCSTCYDRAKRAENTDDAAAQRGRRTAGMLASLNANVREQRQYGSAWWWR